MSPSEAIFSILGKRGQNRRWKVIKELFNSLMFVAVIWGVCIVLGTFGFYMLEHGTTSVSLLDSFYWAMQVATTTGPGDVTPKTDGGKLLFVAYNLIVSVGLLLLLGANIVVRAIKNADILTNAEQEWCFGVIERIYAMQAWNTRVNFAIANKLALPMPLLQDQNSQTGEMPPCPPQPHDLGEDEGPTTSTS